MFYFESVNNPLDTLEKTLEAFFKNQTDQSLSINQPIFERYFFISLYTIWETYMTEIITDIYVKNEKILNSDKFDYYYYENIFTSRNLKDELKKRGVGETLKTIQPDFIFSTSNLWFQKIIDIFKVYGFDIDSLENCFSKNEILTEAIEEMVGSSIELTDVTSKINMSVSEDKQTNYHKVQLYIGFLVDRRNSLAHVYTSPYPKDDPDTMKKMINLFRCLFACFDKYLKEQLLEKNLIHSNYINHFKNVTLLADKKAKNNKLKVSMNLEFDTKLSKDTRIVFFEKGKPIHNKYKIFRILSIDDVDIKDLSDKHFSKDNKLSFLLESFYSYPGMKKKYTYEVFIDSIN